MKHCSVIDVSAVLLMHLQCSEFASASVKELLVQILADDAIEMLCHADNTSDVVFLEEHSPRGLAVHVEKASINIMSDVAARYTVQWSGHQGHHTTRLWTSNVEVTFDISMWIIMIQ
jgi:hypothetical protein